MANLLSETGVAIISPLQSIWLKIVEGLPGLVAALIVLIVGVFIAIILGHAVRVILEKVGLEKWIRQAKLTKAVGHTNVPAVAGEIVKWYLIVLFLAPAVSLVNLGVLSQMLITFAGWLPKLIGAIVVFLVGLAGIHYLYILINEHTKMKGMRIANKILATILAIILILGALSVIGIKLTIAEDVVKIVIGALAVGFALAFGISLGLGMKKEGENFVKEIKKGI